VTARIGIDLGGTKIEGILLEANGEISRRLRVDTPKNDYAATVDALVDMAHALDPTRSAKVGVGAPGSWIAARGQMQNCNSTWLNRRPLLEDLNQALEGRVKIANDADCFTLSEAHGGNAGGGGIVFGVILGTGVGGGLVVDGQLLAGPNGLVGEWGHTPIVQTAPELASRPCYCGRQDCVETYLSGPGLLKTHEALWRGEEPGSARAVYQQAALDQAPIDWWLSADTEGPEFHARRTLGLYCEMLAANLARIVNTLDPHIIVLGGGLSQMSEIYPIVRTLMQSHVFGEVFDTVLKPPRFGAASGVRGAAWLWDPG
jgi:fructokinase